VCIVGGCKIARLTLAACPWAAAVECSGVLETDAEWHLGPVGNALDCTSIKCCSEFEFAEWGHGSSNLQALHEAEEHCPCIGCAAANISCVNADREHDARESTATAFDMLLAILCAMDGKEKFSPLHASVRGCLCHPWHLVAMKKLFARCQEDAVMKDNNGHLLLHLHLESCVVKQKQAIASGHA